MAWYEFTGCINLLRVADKVFNFANEALVIFPFIFYKTKTPSKTAKRRHHIHLMQQLELCFVLYYIVYWLDFWYAYYHYRDFEVSHSKVRFEQEAIMTTCNNNNRRVYGWLRYRISREP